MCQQCQATLRKGHILIFLVCFSVDVPEALGLCCWSEPAGAWQRAGTPGTPRQGQRTVPGVRACQKAPQSCPSRGQQRFPPCTHLLGQRGIHTGGAGVPIHRLQLASSRGDFIVLPSSPTVCNPAFPTTLSCLYITFYLRGSYL